MMQRNTKLIEPARRRIEKAELAKRLDDVLGQPVGMNGLNILLYGWRKYRKYGAKYGHAIETRSWLYRSEVVDLSDYAGYDLTQNAAQ